MAWNMRTFALGCLAALVPVLSLAAEPDPAPPRYEIEARLDTASHRLTATETVTCSNPSPDPVDAIVFNVYPHRAYKSREIKFMYSYGGYFKVDPYPEGFQGGDLSVRAVREAGRGLEFVYSGKDCTLLEVKLGRSLAPGETVTLSLDFTVDIPHSYGRFGWHNGIIALNRWYPMLAVLDKTGCHRYPFYLFHHPYFSDAAMYVVSLTLPRDEVVASTGVMKREEFHADGTRTLRLETAAPVRDFSLGVSRRFREHTLTRGGLTVRSYYLEGDGLRAKEAAQDAAELIASHSARFFPYPYPEFSIVPCYLGYGGENSSCLIFIDTRVWRLPRILNRYFDFLISHETGHQWFYNAVGSDEYREMFLDEGVNSYWTIRYLEEKYGPGAQVMELPKWLSLLVPNFTFRDTAAVRYLFMAGNGLDRPVIGELSSFQEPSSIFALAYGKGQAILEMLERMTGRAAFDRAMKRYAQEYRFRNASLADFEQVFNAETGADLGWFFEEWLKTKKTCDYAVERVKGDTVFLANRGQIRMPVRTVIACEDGSVQEDDWDGAGAGRIVRASAKVKSVSLDPAGVIVLDTDRVNNSWPRRTVFKAVPLYNPAYELPMMQDRGAYNAAAGPALGSKTGLSGSVQKPFNVIGKLSSVYDFNGKAWENKFNYELSPAFGTQARLGFELYDYNSRSDAGDIRGGKLYYRKELFPASYGLFDTSDHVTFYFLRDRRFDASNFWYGQENVRELVYTRHHESVLGIAGSLGRYGPYPDPDYGWRVIPVQEFGGHFLGGTQDFWRSSLELDNYILVWPRHNHKIATRVKGGWGGSADKNLFQLGGADDLRGYAAKSIQGSRMLLASIEYRLPLVRTLAMPTPGNYVNLDTVQLVAFFDTGKAWNTDFSSRGFARDLGLGLRFHFDTIGFLEKTILRVDLAKALDAGRETRAWVGVSQSF